MDPSTSINHLEITAIINILTACINFEELHHNQLTKSHVHQQFLVEMLI